MRNNPQNKTYVITIIDKNKRKNKNKKRKHQIGVAIYCTSAMTGSIGFRRSVDLQQIFAD